MYYNAKKERLKEIIYIIIIFVTAITATYTIYNHFESSREKEYTSNSLDVTFQESTAEKITLNKIIPVTDSLGLSSKAYTFKVENNKDTKVDYSIVIMDDLEVNDLETTGFIPKDIIKISIREDKEDTVIYTLSSLEEGILLDTSIDAHEEKEYSIRVWTTNENNNLSGAELNYNGIIQILEENNSLALAERSE